MNYRHIYHAGNFADIFKHAILALILEKLCEKTAPFFVLDTHAGIGKYDLADEKSLKTAEFIGAEKFKKIEKFLPRGLLGILARANRCEISTLAENLKIYTGSPIIIRNFLRDQDRAIFAELNREDFFQLKRSFAGSSKISTVNQDGLQLIRSKLPPLEKRGLILIDPAFEKDQNKVSADYKKIIDALVDANKRFAHGIYAIWHPIIKNDSETLEKFYREMVGLKFEKILHITFSIGTSEKMTSCGMFVINSPWQLDEKLNSILPKVLEVLKLDDSAKFQMSWVKNS